MAKLPTFVARIPPSRRRLIGFALLVSGIALILLSLALAFVYREKPSTETAPKADVDAWVPPRASSGLSIAPSSAERVVVSKIGVNEEIHEGVDDATLNLGVGHFPGTARPGETGNCALTAHAASGPSHGAPFERLWELRQGDQVIVYDARGQPHRYRVTEHKIIDETDWSVIEPTTEPSVTLITCVVPSRVTHKRRVIVGTLRD